MKISAKYSKLDRARLTSPAGIRLWFHSEITRSGRRESGDRRGGQFFLEAVEDMLSFHWHRNLSLIVSLLRFIVLLLQSYAIGNGLHRFSYHTQLVSCLLDRASHGRYWLQTMLKQIDESITVILAHARYVKGNSIDFELSFGLIVVKLGLIESDEF